MLSPLAYWLLLLAVTAYAFGRGRFDQQLAISICLIGSIATVLVGSPLEHYYSDIELGVFAVDILALFGFIFVALRSNRFWPLWVAGFQLTSIFSHLLKALHWGMIPQVYAAAERFWIYPIFLAIVVGTWRSHRRHQLSPSIP
jgi:hypothetical protein